MDDFMGTSATSWQTQNQYVGFDSGIQSPGPAMAQPMVTPGYAVGPPNPGYYMSPRPQTSEMMVQGQMMYHQPQVMADQAQPPQAIAVPPSNPVIENLVDDDPETIRKVIPSLVILVSDPDLEVADQAAQMLCNVNSLEVGRKILLASPKEINTIVSVLAAASGPPNLIKNLTEILSLLCAARGGKELVGKCGGIPAIVHVLDLAQQNDERNRLGVDKATLFRAITLLHDFLSADPRGTIEICRSLSAPRILTPLLALDATEGKTHQLLAILADLLNYLCDKHEPSRREVIAANGVRLLLTAMVRHVNYDKLQCVAVRLLKWLIADERAKATVVESGGLQTLTHILTRQIQLLDSSRQMPQMFKNVNQKVLLHCLLAIRTCSDAAVKLPGLDTLLRTLIRILHYHLDRTIIACTVGIISNLTADNIHNKIVVCEEGGVDLLLQRLEQVMHGPITQEQPPENTALPALMALRHLTGRYPKTELAHSRILAEASDRSRPKLQLLIGMIAVEWGHIRPAIVRQTCAVIRNLAAATANRPVLLTAGCVDYLGLILFHCNKELWGAHGSVGTVPMSPPPFETRLDDLAEQATGALHCMLKDETGRIYAYRMGLAKVLYELANCPLFPMNETLKKEAGAAYYEINDVSAVSQQQQLQQQAYAL